MVARWQVVASDTTCKSVVEATAGRGSPGTKPTLSSLEHVSQMRDSQSHVTEVFMDFLRWMIQFLRVQICLVMIIWVFCKSALVSSWAISVSGR